jgi:hypothetical protein
MTVRSDRSTRPSPLRSGGLADAFLFLVAAHSSAVGLALAFVTDWSLSFGGWKAPGEPVAGAFFAHMGGVFHLVVAAGYVYEYLRFGTVGLLIIAKTSATIFLTVEFLRGGSWAVGLSAFGDAVMLIIALLLFQVARSNRS